MAELHAKGYVCVYFIFMQLINILHFRRRLEYGLLEDPSSGISDADLISLIRQIRMDMPYSGVSMVCGSLRARGFNITREKVRSALRSIDPLASASRWSAEITNSVAIQ